MTENKPVSAESDTHRIMHRFGGEEVVCTCGEYFRTDYASLTTLLPWTAVARWAEHYRKVRATPEACHCGQPFAYGYDGDPTHHRGMCEHCDMVRCDAHPGECGREDASVTAPGLGSPEVGE